MKIGIFAGTFDPIHNGHIAFAQQALRQAGLDRVVIVAEKNPYRKKPHASWDHRQAMIERATEAVERVDHNYQFAAELAHQHTMQNMLAVAEKHYGSENEFWFLVGSDVYGHMHQWEALADHKDYGGFIVALRDDHTEEWLNERQAQLPKPIHQVLIENTSPHISSSKIRAAIASNQDTQDLPENAALYAKQHNLY